MRSLVAWFFLFLTLVFLWHGSISVNAYNTHNLSRAPRSQMAMHNDAPSR